jgi:hypothetical protein
MPDRRAKVIQARTPERDRELAELRAVLRRGGISAAQAWLDEHAADTDSTETATGTREAGGIR